ncbi:DUF1543 domain-containing protein [Flavobacterium aurantiibacter]|uniref:DUF1543 domain-containing protein n=1 Tax=Flavobacterium aurantiibacter TaxID=2023067 RepID=A0A256AB63_9FLAO|nr:DUF1543 domain-containing protein [Flavobacterium aurantiibacter]OYQ50390.1 hypothetical protein CHX27_00895 [Flavobacterium aurantiibacter]
MKNPFIYLFLLGGTPNGRLIEQHDLFFGIAEKPQDLKNAIKNHWPEAGKSLHIDGYLKMHVVSGFSIKVSTQPATTDLKLFVFNLGGYKPGVFTEFHDLKIVIAKSLAEATARVKKDLFFTDYNAKGAPAHVDDKYALDIDEVFQVNEHLKALYPDFTIDITPTDSPADELILGYFPIDKF